LENCVRFPHLLKSEILDGLDTDFKKNFLNAGVAKVYHKPTTIFDQGEPVSGMAIVAHGYVDISLVGEDGQKTFLARANVGESLGESETIIGESCAANCKTSSNTTLLHCAVADVNAALKNPGFIKNITRIFHNRMMFDNWVKHITMFGSVSCRLRNYLYVLSESTGTVRETQSYLANMVGCSRQTINRELGMLREAGLIAQSGSEIRVLDRAALGEGLVL